MANETTALDILQRQVESLTAQLQKLTGERDEYRDSSRSSGPNETSSNPRCRVPTPRPHGSPSSRPRSATATTTTSSPSWPRARRPRTRPCKHLWPGPRLQGRGRRRRREGPSGRRGATEEEADYAFDPSATVASASGEWRGNQRDTAAPSMGSMSVMRPRRPAAAAPTATRAATARSSPRRCGPTPSSCWTPRTRTDPRCGHRWKVPLISWHEIIAGIATIVMAGMPSILALLKISECT